MPDVIGELIVAAVVATGEGEAFAAFAEGTYLGVSGITAIGSTALVATTIGLSYALRPGLPTAQSGTQALQQAIPPRIRGYGTNRLAGYYMFYETLGTNSYDLMAFHSGQISRVLSLYLHDDPVTVNADISNGGIGTVLATYADGRYGNSSIVIQIQMGLTPQASASLLTADGVVGFIWDPSHQGNGIAHAVMRCQTPSTVNDFTKIYPHQLPLLSVVANCSLIYDPRDITQSVTNRSTWRFSANPVLQLIDYLTQSDGGMGLDYQTVIAPNVSAWMDEANICDTRVAQDSIGTLGPLYASNGWYAYDNKPQDVIGGILATCDGWLAESGDGTLSLTVGLYRAPVDPPITEKHVLAFSLNYGQPDESSVNQLDITFTDPTKNFTQIQPPPWRDENDISLSGIVRPQALDLKWVHSYAQANRLADRAMQRLNPLLSGTFTTTLYGLRYLGKRWVPLQYPFVSGLQNCIVEIQGADVDLMAGRIVFTFILIDPSTIESFNPATDLANPPASPATVAQTTLMREDLTPLVREDLTNFARES